MKFFSSLVRKNHLNKIGSLKYLPEVQSLSFTSSARGNGFSNQKFNMLFFCPRNQEHLNNFDKEYPNFIKANKPKSISITDTAHNPQNSHRAIMKLLKSDISAEMIIPHLAMIAHSKTEIDEQINYFKEIGVGGLLAVRGNPLVIGKDKDYKHPQGYDNMPQLLQRIKYLAPNIKMIIGGYPEKHPFAASFSEDLDELKKKVDCGADMIITQHFFNREIFLRFIDKCEKRGIDLPMMPSIMPLGNPKYLLAFSKGANIEVPNEVQEIYRRGGVREEDSVIKDPQAEREAVQYTVRQITELISIEKVERINTYVANNVPFLSYVLEQARIMASSSDYEKGGGRN